MTEHFDILVVGAGPAGIAAAVTAAATGERVGLVDDNPAAGGQIWRSGAAQSTAARTWLERLAASPVARFQGWRVVDSPSRCVLRAEGNRVCRDLGYEQLVLATGARERFLPFPGWTLPNVMGAGGLDAMVRGGLPIAGKRVVVAGTGPLLLAVAAHLAHRGARIVAICEQASLGRFLPFFASLLGEPVKVMQGIEYALSTFGSKIYTGCWPVAVSGQEKLETVTLRRGGRQWEERCDYLACGFHLVPNLELPALMGCRIDNGFVVVDDRQQSSIAGIFCAGEPTGIGGVEIALLEGEIAGLAAAGKLDAANKLALRRRRRFGFVRALTAVTELDPRLKQFVTDSTLVCRCEDVSFARIREHASWREAKLHTRCGMGPCQGRVCGAAAEFLLGWDAGSILSSVRPPIYPVLVSSLGDPDKLVYEGNSLAPAGGLTPKETE
ncbi:MAG: FAD/NAD(P)-binding oxidoreductase [Terracidiphilus sp.]|jgi:NADPH-dependent 2,4-dienoyl-CoA reductase/sulfur reductase-like enzyme